jgi:hypothetical protein
VEGAVHWLHAIVGIVELHGSEHVLGVEALVTGGLPEITVGPATSPVVERSGLWFVIFITFRSTESSVDRVSQPSENF